MADRTELLEVALDSLPEGLALLGGEASLLAERACQDRGGPGGTRAWDATGKPTDWRTLERDNPENRAIPGLLGLNA